jgi:triacylglycerol lipase
VPHGDGSAVLLIPGFLAGDESLAVLATWLKRIGYAPRRSGIRVNVACSDRALDRLDDRLELIHRQSGRQVSLIGHSRGGHFAKALATRRPERVERSSRWAPASTRRSTSASPPRRPSPRCAGPRAYDDRVTKNGCLTDACGCRFARDYAAPFPEHVPLTSIYTRGDGVVWWEACTVPYASCVEVTGSHIGLACNRQSYRVIAETLAA